MKPCNSMAKLNVEPDTAGSLYTKLRQGSLASAQAPDNSMASLNSGRPLCIACDILKNTVDKSLTVSDTEAHELRIELHEIGLMAGSCGRAVLAGLLRLTPTSRQVLGLDDKFVEVLLRTNCARK